MNKYKTLIFCVLVFLFKFKVSEACNGYSLKVNYVRNCMDGSLLKIVGDQNATIDANCDIRASGCVEITKAFKTHKLKYSIKKSPMPPIEGELDACEALAKLKDPTALAVIKAFSIPAICPIKEEKVCSDPTKTVNLGKYKNQLGMAAGLAEIRLESEMDTGKSCVEISAVISKAKRTG